MCTVWELAWEASQGLVYILLCSFLQCMHQEGGSFHTVGFLWEMVGNSICESS